MKQLFVTFTSSPSFSGGIEIRLFQKVWNTRNWFVLSYKKSSVPLGSVENSTFILLDESWEKEISDESAEKILTLIEEAKISAKPEYILGLDGTSYLLYIESGFNQAKYSWWSAIPKGWENLKPIVDALIELAGITESKKETVK